MSPARRRLSALDMRREAERYYNNVIHINTFTIMIFVF
jgi:hypothetical protein